ncbi:MAG TPA: hypothetical protein VEI48_01165 [Candidatus Sulfotelmatobacter sp.]|nr:hypothetical protein [Candidatus Sulfotelmatobacter sp.]
MSVSYGLLQRWRPSTRTSVVRDRGGSRRTLTLDDIERGWRVEDSQARPIGRVAQVDWSGLTISRGFLGRRLFVPLRTVAMVHEGVVQLSVTVAWAEARDGPA